MNYGQWFTRLRNDPEVVKQTNEIQKRKQTMCRCGHGVDKHPLVNNCDSCTVSSCRCTMFELIGYDPDVTTVRKGPVMQKTSDLWKESTDRRAASVDASGLNLFSASEDGLKAGQDGLYCSFCGVQIQRIDATSEKRPKVRLSTEVTKDKQTGELRIEEKIKTVAQTVHACKDCCLQIQKPITVMRV